MAAPLIALGVAVLMALAPGFALTDRFRRHASEASEGELASMRRHMLSSTRFILPLGGATASAVAGVALQVRGRAIGSAWLGVAVVFAIAAAMHLRARERVRDVIGDRGDPPRTPRFQRRDRHRRALVTGFLITWVGGYVVHAVTAGSDAHWDDAVAAALGVVGFGLILIWLLITTRMYLAGDDIGGPAR